MPREVITIQVGQCGNQIGCRFWDLILREHAHVAKTPVFDASLSSFFRNVDSRYTDPVDIGVGDGRGSIRTLKARSILVDMEQGVVNSLLTGPLADLFDARQSITDVSGSGNNWAHGHHVYGPQYRESIEEQVRRAAEQCDSLQCFLLLHSLGGGTGSGLGTFILQSLEDFYPEIFRFVSCVCPSKDDDVITSPYNTTLALKKLVDHAHCVLPVSNDALVGICNQISAHEAGRNGSLTDLPQDESHRRVACVSAGSQGSVVSAPARPPTGRQAALPPRGRESRDRREPPKKTAAPLGRERSAHSAPPVKRADPSRVEDISSCAEASSRRSNGVPAIGAEKPFDRMNSLVAHMLNNLTSSMRFEGSLNLDLNEITMNLVPFPRMHFLLSSMSPLYSGKDARMIARGFHQTFSDVLKHGSQLMNVDPRGSTYMAMAFLVRGSASIADVHTNIGRVRKQLKMLPYNEDAFKIGLCSVPPKGLPYSVLGLANSCAAHHLLGQTLRDFNRLYTRKAHVHHYTDYMELGSFDEAFETVNSLMKDYIHLDMMHEAPASCLGQAPAPGAASAMGRRNDAASLLFAPSAWASHCAVQGHWDGGLRSAAQTGMPRPLI